MKSTAFTLEEFTSRGRAEQHRIEDALKPLVRRALDGTENTRGWNELLDEVGHQWRLVYQEERGQGGGGMPSAMRAQLLNALKHTKDDGDATVDRIAVWLSTAVLAHATMTASDDDEEELFMEWVDMGDAKVRTAHAHTDGQQRPIGEKFDVGDAKMPYPGYPGVDISLWINCRCTLRPVLASEVTSMTAATDEPTTDEDFETEDTGEAPPVEQIAVPWYGVLAPEGIESGDGRGFKEGSLSTRPLPLPLTWQKTSADGHDQNVTVAVIEQAEMVDGQMRGSGHFLTIPEADEAIGLIAAFGRFGVSVDADSADFDVDEMDEENPTLWFSRARVCGACIVGIPAFAEAYVALGEAPADFFGGTTMAEDEESLVADGRFFWDQFADVAPGVTEDGPGWLTHPVDTDRLRDYWTKGAGAAKIAWGVPGDFDRCRANLAQYIKPEYLNGYCANRHKDALGVWPGQEASMRDTLKETEMGDSISLVASAFTVVPTHAPHEFFVDPGFEPGDGRLVQYKNGQYGCPQTITEEGEIFGHIATWKECHSKWGENRCILAPHSLTQYAHFLLGEVLTTEGTVPVGTLTISLDPKGGHAGERLTAQQAAAHYDNACAAYGDVTVGEDAYGIWMHGWVRPGTPNEMVHAARASKLSGDWRKVGGNLEMIAALAVNVPGFRVPRVAASVERGEMLSLVAAGALADPEQETLSPFDLERFAARVAQEVLIQQAAKTKWDGAFVALSAHAQAQRRNAIAALSVKVAD